MTIHFTSDLHFCHKLLASVRGFDSPNEMNKVLIHNWNSVIDPKDTVYFLGDLSLGKPYDTMRILEQLNGNIYWILGNHDKRKKITSEIAQRFVNIFDILRIKIPDPEAECGHSKGKQEITLCHYAMRTWNRSHYGSWHLYGHSHGELPEDPRSRSFDVGVDCHNLTPISYEMVKKIIKTKEEKAKSLGLVFYGHHNPNTLKELK